MQMASIVETTAPGRAGSEYTCVWGRFDTEDVNKVRDSLFWTNKYTSWRRSKKSWRDVEGVNLPEDDDELCILPISKMTHVTNATIVRKALENSKEYNFTPSLTKGTQLPVVWFSASPEPSDVSKAKTHIEKRIAKFLSKGYIAENQVPGIDDVIEHLLIKPNTFREKFEYISDIFLFSSPAFQLDRSRYGDLSITYSMDELLLAYLTSRNAHSRSQLRFRKLMTHKFPLEREFSILICLEGDDGVKLNKDGAPDCIKDLGKVDFTAKSSGNVWKWEIYSSSDQRCHLSINSLVPFKMDDFDWGSRCWDALTFAFFFPDENMKLKLPFDKSEIKKVEPDQYFCKKSNCEDMEVLESLFANTAIAGKCGKGEMEKI